MALNKAEKILALGRRDGEDLHLSARLLLQLLEPSLQPLPGRGVDDPGCVHDE